MGFWMKILIFLMPVFSYAGESAHGEGIPFAVVYQTINISILIFGLAYYSKDKIRSFFISRRAEYIEASEKSAQARMAAQKELEEIKNKISGLDLTREGDIKKAQAQAEALKLQVVDEAAKLSQRIKEDSRLTVELEVDKARKELRAKLLTDSIDAARIVLTKDLSGADQQKLQKDFITNIGV